MNRAIDKIEFLFELPKDSKCIDMVIMHDRFVCAAFDVPEIGIEIYVINTETGKTVKADLPC